MKRKFLKLVLVFIIGLLAFGSAHSQVNMNRWIELNVAPGELISLDLSADSANTKVKVVCGYFERTLTVGEDWTSYKDYFAPVDTMRIYGNIKMFDCHANGFNIIGINLDNNLLLTQLYCSGNAIPTLDISRSTQLIALFCGANQFRTLDVSNLTQLEYLSCDNNPRLLNLDVSKLTQLQFLYCYNTGLTSLDVRGLTHLKELFCYNNNFTTAGLDSIYCALPIVSGNSGDLIPIALPTSSNYDTVMASNTQNAISKNWRVQYRYDYSTFPPTNGTFDCSNIGINDVELNKIEAKIYPNPVIDNLNIEAKENILTLEVFDALGRKVISTNPKQKSITLDVSNLEKGIYILKLQTENGIGSYKVIKN